jgi:hypothetical protein
MNTYTKKLGGWGERPSNPVLRLSGAKRLRAANVYQQDELRGGKKSSRHFSRIKESGGSCGLSAIQY